MKVAIYARYSSDNQRDASIADQFRSVASSPSARAGRSRRSIRPRGVRRDAAPSGFQALMRDALKRIRRRPRRIARSLQPRPGRHGWSVQAPHVRRRRIVTLAEGDITHLHIGFKGTMNALFLKDLADKTHRGLRGRIEAGKSGGGLCYGYRVVRR